MHEGKKKRKRRIQTCSLEEYFKRVLVSMFRRNTTVFNSEGSNRQDEHNFS